MSSLVKNSLRRLSHANVARIDNGHFAFVAAKVGFQPQKRDQVLRGYTVSLSEFAEQRFVLLIQLPAPCLCASWRPVCQSSRERF